MEFLVVLHTDDGSNYGVTVPDLPGCFSAGASVAQALGNLQEAMAIHFEGLIADNERLPRAQEIHVHMANEDYEGGMWAVVDFDVTPYLGDAKRPQNPRSHKKSSDFPSSL